MKKSAPYISIVAPRFLDWMGNLGRKLGLLDIRITGMSLGWIVVSRRPMPERLERHEAVHVWQNLEISTVLSLIMFAMIYLAHDLLPLWLEILALSWIWMPGPNPGLLVYALIWLLRKTKMSGELAYEGHPMEVEARSYEDGTKHISDRPLFGWLL